MFASRSTLRATRAVRTQVLHQQVVRRPNVRFASDASGATPSNHISAGMIGGLIGGGGSLLIVYIVYRTSGLATATDTATQAQKYIESAKSKLKVEFKDKTPEPNEAIEQLRKTATSYAVFIPGGKSYVDAAFQDLDTIKNKHGAEVDRIVQEAYEELRDVSKNGVNLESLSQAWDVLQKHFKRLGDLASDAAQDILGNHPHLKERFGGSLDQLKQMGDQLGPEAKKQVDQTWQQIQDIVKSGVSFESAGKIQKLVQDKTQELQSLGEQAWEKGLEEAKPYLEEAPQVKKLLDENASALKSGNLAQLWNKAKEAVDSGSTQDLEQYINSAKEKAKQAGGDNVGSWLNMIPAGGSIIPQLSKLKNVAQSHSKEAEQLVKETFGEIKDVLDRKMSKFEEVAKSAEKEVKRK